VILSRARSACRAVVLCLLLLGGGPEAFCAEDSREAPGWRFGYSSRLLFDLSRADATTALTLWTKELAKEAGSTGAAKATIYDDLGSLVDAIRSEQIDFVAISSMDYLKIHKQLSLEPALVGTKNGKYAEDQLLLVRRDKGYTRLGHLQDKKLVLTTSGQEIATLWLDTLLAKQGLALTRKHFGGIKETAKAQQAILSVFFNQADACVVHRNAYLTASELNPQVGKELDVLIASPSFPLAVTCFRPNLSQAKKDLLFSSYDRLIRTPAGKQILTLFRIDGTAPTRHKDFEPLENLLKEHERTKVRSVRQAR
jgi:ABC-type phosphate/phosphonate transport system substrate-binding protein